MSVEAYSRRADIKELCNDLFAPIEDYTRIIDIDANNDSAYENRGSLKICIDDISGAIEDYSKAIEINPKNFVAISSLGCAKEKMGLYQEAIEEYTKAIEFGRVCDYCSRAQVKVKINDLDGAIQDYQAYLKTIEKDGDKDFYFFELAKIYFDRKEYEQALEYTNKAIDLSIPTNMSELKNKIISALDLNNNGV